MRLNAPTVPIFLTSFALAVAVVATQYFGAKIPVAGTFLQGGTFEILLFAYGILLLSTILRRF